MGMMSEHINRRPSPADLEKELLSLIAQYNKKRNTFLIVFAGALNKPIPDVALCQEDYYFIADMLRTKPNIPKIDVYLETPGGSGEAAEEIVNLLRSHSQNVAFVVSGEAKSAGTIMVLSGDEILMTKTGSLGPIDAQIKIGRGISSAFDYMEWVDEKQKEAEAKGRLNPFDAIMVAQISPGELKGVYHSLKFAEDLVVEWLKKYKFKDWNATEVRKIPVTEEMKERRAKEIVAELINHAQWRSHGRSIKIEDLEKIKLKITKVDDDAELSDIVYRIQTICRMLFSTTTAYKIFATQEEKIFKQALQTGIAVRPSALGMAEVIEIDQQCPKCNKVYKIYAKLVKNSNIDNDQSKKGRLPFPKTNSIKCECGTTIDLTALKNNIEATTGKKIILD